MPDDSNGEPAPDRLEPDVLEPDLLREVEQLIGALQHRHGAAVRDHVDLLLADIDAVHRLGSRICSTPSAAWAGMRSSTG